MSWLKRHSLVVFKDNQPHVRVFLTNIIDDKFYFTTTLDILDDKKMKQHLINTRDYLKGFLADDSTFILFSLSDSKAVFWTIENNIKENSLKKIEF